MIWRGFGEDVPSWVTALRDNNTTSSDVDVTGAPHRPGISDSLAGFLDGPSNERGRLSWGRTLNPIGRGSFVFVIEPVISSADVFIERP